MKIVIRIILILIMTISIEITMIMNKSNYLNQSIQINVFNVIINFHEK